MGNLVVGKNITLGGILRVKKSVNSVSKRTGSIVTSGGIGIGRNAVVGGQLSILDTENADVIYRNGVAKLSGSVATRGGLAIAKDIAVAGTAKFKSSTDSRDPKTGAVVIRGGLGVGKGAYIGGQMVIENDMNSESSSTGSFVTYGGAGVGGNMHVGGTSVVEGETLLRGDVTVGSALRVENKEDALDAESAAFTVSGGISVGKNSIFEGKILSHDTTDSLDPSS